MADKIMLLDGHSLLNRAFYGLPDLTNAEGKHTNAILGFLNIMLRYVEEEKPTHLLVAFDRKEPTFRHIKYKEYKGTRKPMPAELHEQVPLMKEVLKTMEIPIITQAGIEADDILGTIGKEAEEAGFDVAIVSGDRDLLQLATKKVKIKIPKTKASGTVTEDYYEEDVRELYGVSPTEFIDMKGLMGDTSDNIPGVPGIGEKTAAKIIKDVSAAYDPAYAEAFEKKNCAYFGKGMVINKYTGARGKSGSNDANAEYLARLRRIFDDNKVAFQTAELGKVDYGGGGTIAYIAALYGMEVVDSGVAVLSMHAPWEIISKSDLYEAKKGYVAFLKNA